MIPVPLKSHYHRQAAPKICIKPNGGIVWRQRRFVMISCSAKKVENERYDYSDPINDFLGKFLPRDREVNSDISSQVDFDVPKVRGLALKTLAERVEEGLRDSEWFVTGVVDAAIFSEGFVFKDDSVSTKGIRSYGIGVRKLFDQATSRAELIAVELDEQQRLIIVTWRLEGRVNLLLKPKICPYVVKTTFEVDDEGLISSQLDEFSVPGWRLLLGALLGPWAGPSPAEPVEKLREKYKMTLEPNSK